MHINMININAAIGCIENNVADQLDLEIIAQAVHDPKYHLHRVFTETIGLTVRHYVQRRKLTEAAELLIFSDKPVIETALIAGYESQQAFTTVFKLRSSDMCPTAVSASPIPGGAWVDTKNSLQNRRASPTSALGIVFGGTRELRELKKFYWLTEYCTGAY